MYLKYFEDFPLSEKFKFDDLPNVDNNIVCADSLIDTTMNMKFSRTAQPLSTNGQSKLLNVIKGSGFDAIVGNPPYIKIQDLLKLSDLPLESYKSLYKESFSEGSLEFATAFIQRGVNLLSDHGVLGFIIPNKIFSNKQGKGIRNFISTHEEIKVFEFTDFHSCQIFNASIYTCLLFLERNKIPSKIKNMVKVNNIFRAESISHVLSKCNAISEKSPSNDYEVGSINYSQLGADAWEMTVESRKKLIEKLNLNTKRLEDEIPEGKIFQGIPTGADSIFLVSKIKNKNKNQVYVYSEATGLEHLIESEYLKPVLKGSTNLKHFNKIPSELFLIYPYKDGELIDPKNFNKTETYKYLNLKKNREVLEKREDGKFAGSKFYQFSRPQNLLLWEKDKILVPYLVERFNAHYDSGKNIFVNVSTGGYAIIPPQDEEIRNLLVMILNSSVFNFYIKSIAGDFRGGWFECSKHYLSSVPVPELSKVKIDRKLSSVLDDLYEINSDLAVTTNPIERLKLKSAFGKNIDWLNECVMNLYDLTNEEKDLVNFYDSNARDNEVDSYYKDLVKIVQAIEDGAQASYLTHLKILEQ